LDLGFPPPGPAIGEPEIKEHLGLRTFQLDGLFKVRNCLRVPPDREEQSTQVVMSLIP
jgi:hypothetical protein